MEEGFCRGQFGSVQLPTVLGPWTQHNWAVCAVCCAVWSLQARVETISTPRYKPGGITNGYSALHWKQPGNGDNLMPNYCQKGLTAFERSTSAFKKPITRQQHVTSTYCKQTLSFENTRRTKNYPRRFM